MADPFQERLDELFAQAVPDAAPAPQPAAPAPVAPPPAAAPSVPPPNVTPPPPAAPTFAEAWEQGPPRSLEEELARLQRLENATLGSAFAGGAQRIWTDLTSLPDQAVAGAQQLQGDPLSAALTMLEVAEAQQAAPQSAVPDIRDIHSWSDFSIWAAERLGEFSTQVGTSLATGGLTSYLARLGSRRLLSTTSTEALRRTGALSFGAGAAASNVALEAGSTQSELFAATGNVHPTTSLVAGGVKGVLETLTPFTIARGLNVIPGLRAVEVRGIPGMALRGGALEAATEGTQTAVDLAARRWVDPNFDPFSAEAGFQVLNSMAAGGFTGSTVSGGARALAGRRSAVGFSETLPQARVDAAVAGAETEQQNGAPAEAAPSRIPAPTSPLEQAIAAAHATIEAEDIAAVATQPSPIPGMYRDIQGPIRTLAGREQLLSDTATDAVMASEVVAEKKLIRSQVAQTRQAFELERNLNRYLVVDKRTGKPIAGGIEALSPLEVEEALAVVGTNNAQLLLIDNSKLDDRAITASLTDLPDWDDGRVYFVEGTTPQQRDAAIAAYQMIRPYGAKVSRFSVENTSYQQLSENNNYYITATANGLRVLPSPGQSFRYLGQLSTYAVPTTQRPESTRLADVFRMKVKGDGDTARYMQNPVLADYAIDLAQVKELDPNATAVKDEQGQVTVTTTLPRHKIEVTSPTQAAGVGSFKHKVRHVDQLKALGHAPLPKTLVATASADVAVQDPQALRFWERNRDQFRAFTEELLNHLGFKEQVALTFGAVEAASYFYETHKVGNVFRGLHRVELWEPALYARFTATGIGWQHAAFEILKHELGHLITFASFLQLPDALRNEVLASWQQARLHSAMGYDDTLQYPSIVMLSDKQQLYTPVLSDQNPTYHLGFSEWLAEQTRRWMNTNPAVVTLQDKYFASLVKDLKTLEKKAEEFGPYRGYRWYQAEKPMQWWMEYLRRSNNGEKVDLKGLIMYRLGIAPRLQNQDYFPHLETDRLQAAVDATIQSIIGRLPPDVKITFGETRGVGEQAATANYYRNEKLLVLSTAAFKAQQGVRLLKHEEVHILRELFTEQEWTTLTQEAEVYFRDKPWGDSGVVGEYERLYRADYSRQLAEVAPQLSLEERQQIVESVIAEERVAYMLERRQQGVTFGEKLNDLLDRIIDFLRQLYRQLAGNDLPTLRQVIHNIEAGIVAERAVVNAAALKQQEAIRAERSEGIEQPPYFAYGVHVKASDLQELSRSAIDVWHGTPHVFPMEAELTLTDGRKLVVDLERPLEPELVKEIQAGTVDVTPHPLGRFSLQRIGTGEGAQAYGWGLYFTETEGIAKYYREALSGRRGTTYALRAPEDIKFEVLPGGFRAKPIWERLLNGIRNNEFTLDGIVQAMQYGSFMTRNHRGLQSDYFGYEKTVRDFIEGLPLFQQKMREFTNGPLKAGVERGRELQKQLKTVKVGSPEYGQIWNAIGDAHTDITNAESDIWYSVLDKYGSLQNGFEPWRINKFVEDVATEAKPGALYRVKLNVEPDDLILYDEPFHKQPKKVQDVLRPELPVIPKEKYKFEWTAGKVGVQFFGLKSYRSNYHSFVYPSAQILGYIAKRGLTYKIGTYDFRTAATVESTRPYLTEAAAKKAVEDKMRAHPEVQHLVDRAKNIRFPGEVQTNANWSLLQSHFFQKENGVREVYWYEVEFTGGHYRHKSVMGGVVINPDYTYTLQSDWFDDATSYKTRDAAMQAFETKIQQTDKYKQLERRAREAAETIDIKEHLPRFPEAVEKFLQAGVKGIRYLDGISRKKGEGAYNYVIFDESAIQIVERNGTAVDESLKQQVMYNLKQKGLVRSQLFGRERYYGDIRDEPNWKPQFIAKVADEVYAAGEWTNLKNEKVEADPPLANYYFFWLPPGQPEPSGNVKQQLSQLGRMVGQLQLTRRSDGYETDWIRIVPEFRGRSYGKLFQEWAGQQLKFIPRPSGQLLEGGYKMWLKRDPQAVEYYVLTEDGDYLSPTYVRNAVNSYRNSLKAVYSEAKAERLKEYEGYLRRIPKEAFEPSQLMRHYQISNNAMFLARLREQAVEAERRKDEQELLESNPATAAAAKAIQRRQTLLEANEQKPDTGEVQELPSFYMGQIFKRLFQDPSATAEDKEISRHLTGTVLPNVDKIGKVSKRWWGLKQLEAKNPHVAELTQYTHLVDAWNTARMSWISKGDEVMRSWKDLGRAEAGRLGELLFYMTNMEYRTPAEVQADVVRQPTPAEVQAAFRSFRISGEGQQVYDRVNGLFAEFLTELETQLTAELARNIAPNTLAYQTALTELQGSFTAMRQKPYFPFMRHGRHTLTVRDSATNSVLWFSTHDTITEQKQAVGAVARRYPRGSVNVAIGLLPEDVQQFQGLPGPLLKQLMTTMPNLTPTQKEWLGQLQYDLSPSHSFRRRLAKRTGTPGYSLNAQRSFAAYFMYGGTHLSRLQYREPLQTLIDQVRTDAKRLANTPAREMIAEYMEEHLSYIMDGSNDAFKLKALVTMWYLGFSVSSALVNSLQVPMVSLPMLGTLFGNTKATAALTSTLNMKRFRRGVPGPNATAAFDKVRNELIAQGYITIGLASELAGYAQGRNALTVLAGDPGQRAWQYATYYSMWMFQEVERFNREVVAEATWKLAMADPQSKYMVGLHAKLGPQILATQAKLGITPHEAAALFAIKDVIDTTQFNYSAHMRAPVLRGKTVAVLMPFAAYLHSMLNALFNAPGAAKMWLMLLFASGLMGLPGAGDIDELIKLIARRMFGKDFSIEEATRRWVVEMTRGTKWDTIGPDLAMHGVSRMGGPLALIPEGWGAPRIDLSGSMGLGRLVPGLQETARAMSVGRRAGDVLEQGAPAAAGASVAVLYGMFQFMYNNPFTATAKEWERGMPKAIRGLLRGYRYMSTGKEVTNTGATLVNFNTNDPDDLATIIAQMAGFTPTRVAQKWQAVIAQTEVQAWYTARAQWLYEKMDRAMRVNDAQQIAAVMQEIQDYNTELSRDGLGSLAINGQRLQTSLRNRIRGRVLFENDFPARPSMLPLARRTQELYPEVYNRKTVR